VKWRWPLPLAIAISFPLFGALCGIVAVEVIYNIAAKHLQTVRGCVDRLHELGATHELRLLTGRLQRLSFRATPIEEAVESGVVSREYDLK
jgi:hypothetical protein